MAEKESRREDRIDFVTIVTPNFLHYEAAKCFLEHGFHIFCEKGYPLSLDKAARGMKLAGKTEGMDGSLVPQLWKDGQFTKVLEYLTQDVQTTLDLASACETRHRLEWFSNTGRLQHLALPKGWLSVNEALNLPEPDTSWMSDPWTRSKFTGWLGAS